MDGIPYLMEDSFARRGANYWIEKLRLKPHPEGGYYRETWQSDILIPPGSLPPDYDSERCGATLIYYLLRGEEKSQWHRVRSPEIWLWHGGDTLSLFRGGGGLEPLREEPLLLGPGGDDFQGLVPPMVWQSAELRDPRQEGAFALVSCLVSPGFSWKDFFLRINP